LRGQESKFRREGQICRELESQLGAREHVVIAMSEIQSRRPGEQKSVSASRSVRTLARNAVTLRVTGGKVLTERLSTTLYAPPLKLLALAVSVEPFEADEN